jgi:hypothetical protein
MLFHPPPGSGAVLSRRIGLTLPVPRRRATQRLCGEVGGHGVIEAHLLSVEMTMRELLIVLFVVVVVFLVGFFWPGRSRRMQEGVKDKATVARDKSRHRAGKLGDWTATSIDKSRRMTERSVHAGRMAHDKTFRSERGAQEEQDLQKKYGEGAERGEASSDEEPRDRQ